MSRINLPKIYSQLDPSWINNPIGNSTIGRIGCLTADAAMVACFFGHNETPATLATKIKYSGNLYVWSELCRLYTDIKYARPVTPDITRELTNEEMDEIRGAIGAGCPVFIKIETKIIPEHWVLGVDYNGDDIQVADPLQGKVHPLTDYGIPPKEVIYTYGWYSNPYQKEIADLKKEVKEYKDGLDIANKRIKELESQVEDLMRELEEKPIPSAPQPQETPQAPVPVEVKPDPTVEEINKKMNILLSFIEGLKRFIHIKW